MLVDLGTSYGAGTIYSSQRKIIKTSTGTLIAFNKVAKGRIQYKVSTNGGVDWSSWSSDVYYDNANEITYIDVFLDSNDDLLVAIGYKYGSVYRMYFKRLTYQGNDTWTIGNLITVQGDNVRAWRSPHIAIRSNGDIWLVYRRTNTAFFYYNVSVDGGTTWSAYSFNECSDVIMDLSILAKDDNIWVFTNTQVDLDLDLWEYNGASWSSLEISGDAGYDNFGQISSIKIANDDIWLAAAAYAGIEVFHYTGSWDAGTFISSHINKTDVCPSIADISGNPLVVWGEVGASSADLVYRMYNGASWNAKVNLTEDAVEDTWPTTSYSSSSVLYVIWTRGTYNLYFDSVSFAAASEEFINETLFITESIKLHPTQKIAESIKIAESVDKRLFLSDSLVLSDYSLVPQIFLEESIVHYRDFMQSYNYQNLNPPYHYETWYIENPTPGTSINRVLPSYFVGSIENVITHCKNKGSSGETKVNVKLNGDSIFYNETDKPVLPFDASKNYDQSNEPYLKLIGKNDLITVDIESVAVGATGLTVNVAISQTSIPISVQKIEAIDENGFVYAGTDILGSNTVYFKVYFSTSFLFPPSIQIVDSEGSTTDLELDTISTTVISNDTVTTKSIDTSEYVGSYSLVIKNATSATGILQDPFEKKYLFSDENISDYLEYDKYSNEAEVFITISNLSIFKSSISSFSYSLNDVDWTDDVVFTNPLTINITNSTVGGSTAEEDKTIYLRFKNKEGSGHLSVTVTIGYYYSAISFDAYYVRHSSDMYVVDYSLPDSATTVPLKGLDIYNGSTLVKSLTFENLPLSDFNITSTWEDANSRFKIDVDAGYTTGSKGDAIYSIEASTFYINQPTDNPEKLYLVMVEVDTNTVICQEVLTRTLDTAKYLTHEDFIDIVANYKEDYIVLYGVHVFKSNLEEISIIYNYVYNYTLTAIVVEGITLDLSIKITDQAGRTYTNNMADLTKNNKMKISVHLAKDLESDAVTRALTNAAIVNELPDSFYVTGEYIDE